MKSVIFRTDANDTIEVAVDEETGDLAVTADDGQTPIQLSIDPQAALLLANTIWDLMGEDDE